MYIELDDKNFQKEVLESSVAVLVDFWAPWCGPCKMISSVIDEIAIQYKDSLKVCKLNIDESCVIISKYNITSIPTLMVFKNGEAKAQNIGALPKEDLEQLIKPYLKG
jgi:thioredoxin 1